MFESIGAGPESAKAANESRGEEREHGSTLDTIWVSMKWQEAREMEDEKAFHLLFDEQDARELEDQRTYAWLFDEDDSTSVPA